jgi:hypothetical protein
MIESKKIEAISLTVPANDVKPFPVNGYSFLLLTNDQSTDVLLSIDGSPFVAWPVWRKYSEREKDKRFSHLQFKNTTGTAMALTGLVSEGDITIATEYGSLTNIASLLTTIDGVLDNLLAAQSVSDVITQIDDTVVAQTGSTGTQLVTAGTGKRKAYIQFNYDDAGSEGRVYIGPTTAVSATNKMVMLVPGDGHLFDVNDALFAVSKNGTETVWGYVISKS